MRHAPSSRSLSAALFAVVLATSGLTAAPCAGMVDCAVAPPVGDCHGASSAERSIAAAGAGEAADCCVLAAAGPAAPGATEAAAPIVEPPAPTGPLARVAAPRSQPATGASRAVRPAGRALLSLHQTFLI